MELTKIYVLLAFRNTSCGDARITVAGPGDAARDARCGSLEASEAVPCTTREDLNLPPDAECARPKVLKMHYQYVDFDLKSTDMPAMQCNVLAVA